MTAPPIRLLERIVRPSEGSPTPDDIGERGSSRVLIQTPDDAWSARALYDRVHARALALAGAGAHVQVVSVDKALDDVITILAGLSLGKWVVVQNPHPGAVRWSEPKSWPHELHGQAGVVVATSGSTGAPKWVAISEAALGWSAVAAALRLGLRADDMLALQLPLYHVGGLGQLFRALWMHVPLLIGAESTPRALQAHGATVISVVPTQLARWIQRGYRGDGFRTVIVGGAPLTASLREAALSHGFPVRTTYGATETASMISLSEIAPAPGTSGRLLAYRDVVIDDDHDEEEDLFLSGCQTLAKELNIWIHIGSIVIKLADDDRMANRAFMINDQGQITARYDKIHMFDVDLEGGESYRESKAFRPGEEAIVTDTPWGKVGLTICYDVRFPHLHRSLAAAGARLILNPAAFTQKTGEAHWHSLLTARAIETTCFVAAAAQTGHHDDGRDTYGHSLAISPWGEILADGKTDIGIIRVDLDMDQVTKTRAMVPSLQNGRDFSLPV